jgi:hypothetical protein
MAWNEISLDDLDEQIKDLQITNETKKEPQKNDPNKGVDSRASVKSARKEDEDDEDWDNGTNVRTDSEAEDAEEEHENEDEDEVEVTDESDDESEPTPRRGNERTKSDRNVGGDKSDESDTVRRALAEAQRERDELQRQLNEAQKAQFGLRKTSLESQRDSIAGEIKTLKAQVSRAKADGDHEAETDLMMEIQKKQLKELAIESALEDVEVEVKRPAPAAQVQQPQANAPAMPPEAQKFVQRNAWIATAPEAVRMAIVTQSQIMIDQGKDPNSAQFYDALATRLNTVLDGSGYVVNAGNAKAASKKAEAPAKKKGSPIPPKEQSTKVYRDAQGNTKVVATRADKEAAERLGLDLKLYMQEKLKMEKATGGNAANWSSIKV